jgi:hypothetical protein
MAAEKKTKTENEGRATTSETKAPLAIVLERYGDGRKTDNRKEAKEAREAAKKKLVADLVGRLELRGGESRDQLRARLGKTSNAKLLRLRERVEGS